MRNTKMNYFSGDNERTGKYIRISRQEAEKNFVLYFHRQQNKSDKIAPDEAIQKLESGEYDADLVEGLRLVAALWHGMHTGCFMLSDEQNLVLWRWTVAAVYVCEMLDTNGTVEVKNEQGEPEEVAVYSGDHGGIVIYPWSERFSLANHVEGLAYEMFPANKAPEMAAAIYRSMIDISPVTGIDMSEEGLKGMSLLHDSFIETLKTECIPAAPVAH
ncbi:hypothetical protein KVI39_005252 [Salmonella enterica]|uniref:Uncharacterized protein n=2 Tax=Salmonella enterica TaxID=28901 RepID=A0A5U3L0S9_SALER|nr:hypothetical protein [Salmonella enterica]EBP3896702.1 hypothetical protein [Salmonella enterica subsp. enterica]EBV8148294.1 hypothetical protein [Salmonella enterica subsp. enterica serovar Rubislaw]EDJ3057041.1 hypothetical protein [Salmonella enterica subsp. enterica serovar Muenchen]EDK5362640.1 hypothetical protein [Salmonella enterica subsp. enterica serovar Newport]EEE5077481.1 hypothetical protein [Salmonella enterica subsp. enterica serovar Thompson]